MSDRGSQAGPFREDTPAAETEIPLNIPEEEPQTASETKPQPLPEQIYMNTPPSREPKNIRINMYDRDPTNMNELVKVGNSFNSTCMSCRVAFVLNTCNCCERT